MAESELKPLIIDTACGVDDALALILAMTQMEKFGYKVVAITCVVGNVSVQQVSKNVAEVMRICEQQDIPVHIGASHPILRKQEELFNSIGDVHGTDGLNDYWKRCYANKPEPELPGASKETAAAAIVRHANENNGNLHYVSCGPDSNLAAALLLDRSIPSKIKRLVLMGGAITAMGNVTHAAEFNMWADPEASALIFRNFSNIELVSWEVSSQVDEIFNSEFITKYSENYDNQRGIFINKLTSFNSNLLFCDPIAVAVMLDPSVVAETTDRECYVEMHGNYTRGMLIVNWHSSTISHVRTEKNVNTKVITKLDLAKIANLLLESIS